MSLLVKKFGGSSLADSACLQRVVTLIAQDCRLGKQVVVVVSAQAGETDRLVKAAQSISSLPDAREYDALLSSAEQASAALLSLMLIEQSIPAVSLSAHQSGIITNTRHARASIEHVDTSMVHAQLCQGNVVVVAGFQGVTPNGDIATLGRGGSDMTAVVLAGALQAEECQIYTDVPGVFRADPGLIPEASCLPQIALVDMLTFSRLGAVVMQQQALDYGYQHAVPLRVLSTFDEGHGTRITREPISQKSSYVGVACQKQQVTMTLRCEGGTVSLERELVSLLQQAEIPYDLMGSSHSDGQSTLNDVSWSIPESCRARTEALIVSSSSLQRMTISHSEPSRVKVSLVGSVLLSHHAIASQLFGACESHQIPVLAMASNESRISVLVDACHYQQAARLFFRYVEVDADVKSDYLMA